MARFLVVVWCCLLLALAGQCLAVQPDSDEPSVLSLGEVQNAISSIDTVAKDDAVANDDDLILKTCHMISESFGETGTQMFDRLKDAVGKPVTEEQLDAVNKMESAADQCGKVLELTKSQCEALERKALNGGPKTREQEEAAMIRARMREKLDLMKSKMSDDMAHLLTFRETKQKNLAKLALTANAGQTVGNSTRAASANVSTQDSTSALELMEVDESSMDASVQEEEGKEAAGPTISQEEIAKQFVKRMAVPLAAQKEIAEAQVASIHKIRKDVEKKAADAASKPKAAWLEMQTMAQKAAKRQAVMMMRGSHNECAVKYQINDKTLKEVGSIKSDHAQRDQ